LKVDLERLCDLAASRGVAFQTLASYECDPEHGQQGLVIGFGGIASERIEPGIARIARCFHELV
jgi:DNA-binding transcriptional MocR family regulator